MSDVDPAVMVLEIVGIYPSLHDFAHDLKDRFPDVLRQLHGTIVVQGGKLIETQQQWEEVPKLMRWIGP